MIDILEKQNKLTSLINYYKEGDLSCFRQLVNLAGYEDKDILENKFLHPNLLQACLMAGIIEINTERQKWMWMCSCSNDINILSYKPKKIFTHKQCDLSNYLKPLIINSDSMPLIQGINLHEMPVEMNLFPFQDSFFDRFPELNSILDSLLIEEKFIEHTNKSIEYYDVTEHKWTICEFSKLEKDSLIRSTQTFWSGKRAEYFLIFPSINLHFKVNSTEWTHIVAMKLLNWDINHVFSKNDNRLSVPYRFRLPNILKKLFFANSSHVEIGYNISFIDLENEIYTRFNGFLTGGKCLK